MKKINVYEFDELDKEAQKTAIKKCRYINVDYDWHDYLVDDLKEDLGIEFNTIYWSICEYVVIIEPHVIDERKFLKSIGVDLRTRVAREYIENGIEIETSYRGHGYNYIPNDYELTQLLNNKLNKFLLTLGEEYYYLTSDESVIESIKVNKYFFKNGIPYL